MREGFSDSAQVRKYHSLKNKLFFVQLALNIFFLLFLLLSNLSEAMRDVAYGITENHWLADGLYIFFFSLFMYAVSFPLTFFEDFLWEHKFKLSNQRFLGWLWDEAKKAFLSLILILIAVEAIYIFLRRFPDTWWVGASLFWLFLSLVLARLMPNVIVPLFYQYSSVDNPSLKERIFKLFKRMNITIKDVYVIDFSAKTKKANAMVCGLGSSRRVILTDNLLKDFDDDEIEAVLAHEIGHYKHHDILKVTAINSVATFLSFFLISRFLGQALYWFHFSDMGDIAFFPMVALGLIILGVVLTPVMNSYSRFVEKKADAFSLETIDDGSALARAFEKLGKLNLAEFAPSRVTEIFFYSHPPLSKRIQFVHAYINR